MKQFLRADSNAKCAEINVEAAIKIEESVICADLANNDTNMNNTLETDKQSFVAEHNEGKELCVEAWFCEIIERERDEALQLLRDIRSIWEGTVTKDECNCSYCEFLRPIDSLLNKYTINQND